MSRAAGAPHWARLRDLDEVTASACLFALTYNILRFITVSA